MKSGTLTNTQDTNYRAINVSLSLKDISRQGNQDSLFGIRPWPYLLSGTSQAIC